MIDLQDLEINVEKINELRALLRETAKKLHYDFNHPEVIAISQQLDRLILEQMHKKIRDHSRI